MALITCPDCQASISDAAPACLTCGRPMLAGPAQPPPPTAPASPGSKQSMPRLFVLLGLLVAAGAFTVYRASSVQTPEQTCTMNGFGAGTCTFTNRNVLPAQECGHIEVRARGQVGTFDSSTFCSGLVWPNSSVTVQFHEGDVHRVCDVNYLSGQTFGDVCSFTFVPAS